MWPAKNFIPDLDLNAFFGFSTIHFHKWFNPASTNWLIHPALHLPLFHGGELSGNLLISKEQFLQEIATYNQMVLDATQEVLDGLSSLRENEAKLQRSLAETALIDQDIHLQTLRIAHNLDPVNILLQKEIGLLILSFGKRRLKRRSSVLF